MSLWRFVVGRSLQMLGFDSCQIRVETVMDKLEQVLPPSANVLRLPCQYYTKKVLYRFHFNIIPSKRQMAKPKNTQNTESD
jgi:hypothetical protein